MDNYLDIINLYGETVSIRGSDNVVFYRHSDGARFTGAPEGLTNMLKRWMLTSITLGRAVS